MILARSYLAAVVVVCLLAAGCAASTAPRSTLQAFSSEQELTALFTAWQEEHPPPPPLSFILGSRAAFSDSVTNVQHAGVDEGGIVKLHGDYLVILRRGRLFTVSIGGSRLEPVSAVDAFGPDVEPHGTWYDEMMISGNRVVVVGYSYARGGTEVGLFEISSDGRLAYLATYQLRSNDYYSARNYASRLIGSKLIFYSPLRLAPWSPAPLADFPAMRRWHRGAADADFRRIAPATRIYRTDEPLDPYRGIALHTVSVCDLARAEFDCVSTAVLGPAGRVFYVSGSSAFVWAASHGAPGANPPAALSSLFRIPLDGSAPSALKVSGSPIDQFSFLEGTDGYLSVLVSSMGRGDGMWAAEVSAGDLALLRVPLNSFSDGRAAAPPESYKALPRPAGGPMQSRYVGRYLLYGAGTGWSRPGPVLSSNVYAVRYASPDSAREVPLAHGVDRIEALGNDAVVVGTDGRDLHFTTLGLASAPTPADRYTQKDAAQGETRSHGFFYRQEKGAEEGVIGLPIVGRGQPASRQLLQESAAVLFLRNRSLQLNGLGALESRADARGLNDGCRASCVDWYGNSRPLFVGTRVFALMGYEIVEGALQADRINETRRINFAPR